MVSRNRWNQKLASGPQRADGNCPQKLGVQHAHEFECGGGRANLSHPVSALIVLMVFGTADTGGTLPGRIEGQS